MLIEALRAPFVYRWPGGKVHVTVGTPVELPDDRAQKLLARHPGKAVQVIDLNDPDPRIEVPHYKEGIDLCFNGGLGFEEHGLVEGHTIWDLYPGEVCYRIGGRTIPHSKVSRIYVTPRDHICQDCDPANKITTDNPKEWPVPLTRGIERRKPAAKKPDEDDSQETMFQ